MIFKQNVDHVLPLRIRIRAHLSVAFPLRQGAELGRDRRVPVSGL